MTSDVSATVDSAGALMVGRRASLGKAAAGGLLFGPVGFLLGGASGKQTVVDTRQAYLLVEGPGFAAMIECAPDDYQPVRELAAKINAAARGADKLAAERSKAVTLANQKLNAVRDDRADADAALSKAKEAKTEYDIAAEKWTELRARVSAALASGEAAEEEA